MVLSNMIHFRAAALSLAVMVLGAVAGGPAHAQHPVPLVQVPPSPLELSQLPRYCWGQYGDAALRSQPGYTIVGCGPGVNHFCAALVATVRASEAWRPTDERRMLANYSALEVRYTARAISTFPSCPIANDVKAAEMRANFLVNMLR
jgi:hypothetical protein